MTQEVMRQRAKNLRKCCTDAEDYLWRFLRNRFFNRYKFKRQYVIDRYIVDFVCLKRQLIIELDGGQHLLQQNYDEVRERFLSAKGYCVLRFWNDVVFNETDEVLEEIRRKLEGE